VGIISPDKEWIMLGRNKVSSHGAELARRNERKGLDAALAFGFAFCQQAREPAASSYRTFVASRSGLVPMRRAEFARRENFLVARRSDRCLWPSSLQCALPLAFVM
jgi:hypothetical protein